MGYEYLDGNKADKIVLPNGVVVYRQVVRHEGGRDRRREAGAREAQGAVGQAGQVRPRPRSVAPVADDPRIGRPPDRARSRPRLRGELRRHQLRHARQAANQFKYGSDKVTIVADKIQPGRLGAVGYDDEGVKTKRWDLIKDGVLVDYQVIRDQAHIIGKTASEGCCYADSWSSVQFQRMANVSLAPGKAKLSVRPT